MSFAHPERLWPLVLTAAIALVLGAVLSRRQRGWLAGLVSLALRAGLLGGLVLLLLGPERIERSTAPGSLLVALDLSRSVPAAERVAIWPRLASLAGASPVRVIGFGERPVELPPPGEGPVPELLAAEGALRSELLPALGYLLLDAVAASGSGRLIVISDGALPEPPADLVAVPGLAPLVIATAGPRGPGFRATGLALAEDAAPGESLQLRFTGTASRGGVARVQVRLDGDLVREVPVELAMGVVEIVLALPAPTPGQHLFAARLVADEDEPLDNAAATWLEVPQRPLVAVVSAEERALVTRALQAQDIEVRPLAPQDLGAAGDPIADVGVVVLDRVSAQVLSAEPVLSRLRRHVERGGGLLYLPAPDRGEMYGQQRKPFLELLPLLGRAPEPEPEPEDDEPEEEPEAGLKPPDPDARKKEKRLAPTLGLLLLLDASRSMQGINLRLAKEAAIAAAEVLHQEDHVAVIAFNDRARTILEMTPAGDQESVIDRISRIVSGGGTHFGRALEAAEELMEAEPFAIKHVIFLSDGESRPAPLKRIVDRMTAAGITVSTVGCGGGFNEQVLSDIAAWGRGKFQPAINPQEVPQVFTIEAERLIAVHGARKREPEPKNPQAQKDPATAETEPDPAEQADAPEPELPAALPFQPGLPAPYVRGVAPHLVPGLLGFHPTDARRGAWVSLQLESGLPVAAHRFLGDGRVIAWTTPVEGPWAAHLVSWEDLHVLLAQMVRFLHPDVARSRFFVTAEGQGRSATVTLFDRQDRATPEGEVSIEVRDETGRRPQHTSTSLGDQRWRIALDATDPAAALVVAARAPGEAEAGRAFVTMPPPPEIAESGLDPARLEDWAEGLGGTFLNELPASLAIPQRVTETRTPAALEILPWLLLLFGVDLLVKRAFPGRRA